MRSHAHLERLVRSSRLREKVRHAEVARLFQEQQDESEWPAAEHAAYMSPWREVDVRGELGPWYGPDSEAAYERDMRAYQETREGGSLWDAEEAAKCGVRGTTARAARDARRHDHEAVARHVHLHQVREDERKVYYAFWVDGLSVAKTATRLGMVHTAVAAIVRRLREAAGKGAA